MEGDPQYLSRARCTASDILVAAQKTGRPESQEKCVPRGVSKVSPYCEVDESILRATPAPPDYPYMSEKPFSRGFRIPPPLPDTQWSQYKEH